MSDDATDEERADVAQFIEGLKKLSAAQNNAQIQELTQAYAAGQADRRATGDPRSAKAIIEKYYRRRARNPKLQLRQHLRDIGEEAREGYIRKAKVAYDKRRKRGKKG